MNATERKVLDRFKELLAKRVTIHKMFLFGSRARGDAEPQSDMDVVVVLADPASVETRDYISECAWEAGFERGIVVVPVVFHREEWETGPQRESLLVRAVETEGVPV